MVTSSTEENIIVEKVRTPVLSIVRVSRSLKQAVAMEKKSRGMMVYLPKRTTMLITKSSTAWD